MGVYVCVRVHTHKSERIAFFSKLPFFSFFSVLFPWVLGGGGGYRLFIALLCDAGH